MKTTLFMAISVNGIIARKDGREDFLSDKNWEVFSELAAECGCLVIGHKTYEDVTKWGDGDFSAPEGVKKLVISREPDFKAPGFETVTSPQAAIEKLSAAGFEKLLISGGSTINGLFAKSNLIDEIVLIVEPVIIGEGIPLFKADEFDLQLSYVSSEELEDGRVKMRYEVKK